MLHWWGVCSHTNLLGALRSLATSPHWTPSRGITTPPVIYMSPCLPCSVVLALHFFCPPHRHDGPTSHTLWELEFKRVVLTLCLAMSHQVNWFQFSFLLRYVWHRELNNSAAEADIPIGNTILVPPSWRKSQYLWLLFFKSHSNFSLNRRGLFFLLLLIEKGNSHSQGWGGDLGDLNCGISQ